MFKCFFAGLVLNFLGLCAMQQVCAHRYVLQAHQQTDSLQISRLFQTGLSFLAHADQQNQLDSAEVYFNKSLLVAGTAKRTADMNKCYLQLGNVYISRYNLPVAEKYYSIVVAAHRVKHETAKRAITWLKLGEQVLNRWTDSRKKRPEQVIATSGIYYSRGLKLLEMQGDSTEWLDKEVYVAMSYLTRGYNYRFLENALGIIQRFDNSNLAEINLLYAQLSQMYRDEGNNNLSLFYMMRAMNRMDRLRDTTNNQVIYGELALIYDELGEVDKSIEWYKKTLALREKMPDVSLAGLYRTAGFMALNLNKRGRSIEGLNYIRGLEKRHPPTDNAERGMAAQVKAYCYYGLRQYQLAEKYYLLMFEYYKRTPVRYLSTLGSYDIADFYLKQKIFSKAAYYLKNLADKDLNLSRQKNIQLMLFKIDSAAGKPSSAIRYYQEYKKLNDSIFNIKKSDQIEELQIKYAINQKEIDLKSVKKDRQLQYERAKHAINAQNVTFIGVGLLLAVIGLLYNSFRTSRRKTAIIDLKNTELNELVREKDDLLEEKEWLIKEVHHRVKNNLQIVMGLLQRQSSFIDNEEALAAIRNSEYRIHAIALIHQKLYQSDNFMLVNMVDYINEMVGYLQECFDLRGRIRFEKQIADIDFEVNIAVPIGLILNEAITNSIKYAFSSHTDCCISILLKDNGNRNYLLEVADNGCGHPADFEFEKINSMGFNLMRGLSKQIGGKMNVANQTGLVIRIDFTIE